MIERDIDVDVVYTIELASYPSGEGEEPVSIKQKIEETRLVDIDVMEFRELEPDEQLDFIKNTASSELQRAVTGLIQIDGIEVNPSDFDEFKAVVDEIFDTSELHPGETEDEYWEHEDFE